MRIGLLIWSTVLGLLLNFQPIQPAPAFAECEGSVAFKTTYGFGEGVLRASCTQSSSSTGTNKKGHACRDLDGTEVPCKTGDGLWNGQRSCYAKQHSDGQTAAEGQDGDHHGVVMECTTVGGSGFLYLARPEEASGPPPPNPRELAQTAVSRMELSAIEIGSFPWTKQKSAESVGVVGWNVWLWVADPSSSTVGPISESASVDGYTVTATAEVTKVDWDMGNGDVVSCGKGTAYPASPSQRDPKSPDCGYVYTKDGGYQISATTHWQINWSGIGESGVIPMELTATEDITIAEVQVLNAPVSNPRR